VKNLLSSVGTVRGSGWGLDQNIVDHPSATADGTDRTSAGMEHVVHPNAKGIPILSFTPKRSRPFARRMTASDV
jgi:hypothetical protein